MNSKVIARSVLCIACLFLLGCGTAVTPVLSGSAKIIAWAPETGGTLKATFTNVSPSQTVTMVRETGYDFLRPAGVPSNYGAYTTGVLGVVGERVYVEYTWFPGYDLRGEYGGAQEFIYTSTENNYTATPDF